MTVYNVKYNILNIFKFYFIAFTAIVKTLQTNINRIFKIIIRNIFSLYILKITCFSREKPRIHHKIYFKAECSPYQLNFLNDKSSFLSMSCFVMDRYSFHIFV